MRSRQGALLVLTTAATAALVTALSGCGGQPPVSPAVLSLTSPASASAAAPGSAGIAGSTGSPGAAGASSTARGAGTAGAGTAGAGTAGARSAAGTATTTTKPAAPKKASPAPARFGNPAGHAAVPVDAAAVDTSHPTRVVGHGTAASCTSAAVVAAVVNGGVIRFSCGRAPVTIAMTRTAKVVNTSSRVVLDGGGLVTLSGGGARRILYMNTCDRAQVWTSGHCQDQATPQLVLQNIGFVNGNSTGDTTEGGGGGAVFVRGGRLKIVNSHFAGNRCDSTGPDLGGAAVRVLSQYHGLPVYVVSSTFEKGQCSNGGALSSIGVSWTVLNSVFRDNKAVGNGANPARAGTPGGGSGGAIYNDGNTMTLRIAGSVIERNHASAGGGAVFFVSNDHTGGLRIEDSVLRQNPNDQFETAGYHGIFFLGSTPAPVIIGRRPTA